MFVRSPRLFLRPPWAEDWREIRAGIADEAIVRNLATVPWPYTEDHARQFAQQAQERHLPHFLMTLPDVPQAPVIGCIGLSRRERGEVELGYWVARAHWGRGYASEAARAVLPLARMLGHRRIVAGHFADNPASGRVLLKAGFRPTGFRAERYSEGRKALAQTVEYALSLDAPCDFDGDEPLSMAA
ncbi:GNAT family N-acetyltransferase [Novosphingobium album (ex Liu et al. 2023)]|uniref:GNAT family N-acetyltransferase n=1 Tax=Novosphingobium album (ex Liu et al. 2023) TaxID=3031130 RepID=A0ABT5WSC0_9SPHN|nr:GNAT family N-acetyltransferase [Novosphingobium album (ex Liu et al. 2023)]MDE8652943.1 GNAT family N-acetyltransferase [Novosphingobium album (ex Liu et al. 2023)]